MRWYQNGGPSFANLSPRLSLFVDHLRTALAVKGSLRRAQQRRALDGSGPFRTTLLRRGKGSLRTAPLAGDHFAAILVPFSPPPTARYHETFVDLLTDTNRPWNLYPVSDYNQPGGQCFFRYEDLGLAGAVSGINGGTFSGLRFGALFIDCCTSSTYLNFARDFIRRNWLWLIPIAARISSCVFRGKANSIPG